MSHRLERVLVVLDEQDLKPVESDRLRTFGLGNAGPRVVRRTIASPSPSPPKRRVIDVSACEKRLNKCGMKAASMPWPVSVTVVITSSPSRSQASSTEPPVGVNFNAFERRFANS